MKRMSLLFAIIVLLFTGCHSKDQTASSGPEALSILIVNTSCRETPDIKDRQISGKILSAIQSQGHISIINVDGDPSIPYNEDFLLNESYAHASKSKLKDDAQAAANSLLDKLTQMKADDAEVDLLKAIDMASISLQNQTECTVKRILIMDTGLSTAGAMDFQKNLISANPEILADLLESRALIPNLTGVQVIWLMTNAKAPQVITHLQAAQIEAIWKTIVERGGGVFDCQKINPAVESKKTSAGSEANLPPVSVVDLPEESPIEFDRVSVTDQSGNDVFKKPVFLSEEQIRFVPDSSQFLEPETAAHTLSPIADYLKSHPDVTLLLAGTTAGDTDSEKTFTLSLSRAEAVKSALLSQGISESQLITRGLGSSDPWHVYGVGVEGEAAIQNRKVVLLDVETDLAKKLL